MERIFVYPKDVSALTGKSIRDSQTLLRHLRLSLKKKNYQGITKFELAIFLEIDVDLIVLK